MRAKKTVTKTVTNAVAKNRKKRKMRSSRHKFWFHEAKAST